MRGWGEGREGFVSVTVDVCVVAVVEESERDATLVMGGFDGRVHTPREGCSCAIKLCVLLPTPCTTALLALPNDLFFVSVSLSG